MAELVRGAQSRPQVDYALQNPRQALAQNQAGPWRTSDPRLSPAGNRVSRQLTALLEQLARKETWLSQRGRSELNPQDRELLGGGFVRLGRDARTVADPAQDLGQELTTP